MFGASGQNNGSRVGREATAVPTRFVWPHGGRRVFVCGSFTRWTDHIPMAPMEGCPTVFQVIYNLTPGYHQYKFFVDGEWRHDDHQPFVNGNYGVVNTIFLPRESEVPAFFSPEIPGRSNMDVGRSNMDVDNDPFVPLEAVPSLSQDDIDLSRQRISTFLSMHTAYELLPESGKVIALDVNLPVRQAFHILHEQGISVAPLWDLSSGRFVGVLSALDFIMILQELGSRGFYLTEEELETHSILAWKEEKMKISNQIDGNLGAYQSRLIHAGPYDSLRDVAIKLVQNKVATVPIIHCPSRDGSFPQLLHLASLSGILKCICRNFRHSSGSLPILQQPICALPLGTWVPKIGDSNGKPLAVLRPNASLNAALSLLVQAGVSSVPIVDDNDALQDIYCRSDITALAKDKAYTRVHLDELSICQALQLGQDANASYGIINGQRCQMCLRSDPLHKVMERLAVPGVRRLVIVEAGSKRVEGIISLSDVFKFLLG